MHRPFPTAGLYAITDGPRSDLLAVCSAALRGGARLLQYRDKTHDDERRRREASSLVALCEKYSVPLIINDDIELAADVRAAGAHLGKDDVDIAVARAQLGPEAIIGASCYDSLDRARDLATAGADYLAFGAFFPTSTKPNARRATMDLLSKARQFGKPLVAIGGITPDNASSLAAAGADFVAVVSGVFGSADPETMARRYAALFTK